MAIETIYPTKDSWLDSTNPTTNYGNGTTLEITAQTYFPTPMRKRAIFHFNLSAIPAGVTINSALLRLYATQGASVAHAAYVRRLTQPNWTELFCTWNDYAKQLAWTTPGGDYTTTDQVAWSFPTSTGLFDITGMKTLVEDAIANRSNQLHLLLMQAAAGAIGNPLIVASRENADSGKWSRLIVDSTSSHVIAIDGACVGIEDQIITVG